MTPSTPPEAPAEPLRCVECEHEVAWCSFCDGIECTDAICYRCLAVRVGEAVPQPHAHGG